MNIKSIKNKIQELKNDNTSLKKQIKCFTDNELANQLFGKRKKFSKLKETIEKELGN